MEEVLSWSFQRSVAYFLLLSYWRPYWRSVRPPKRGSLLPGWPRSEVSTLIHFLKTGQIWGFKACLPVQVSFLIQCVQHRRTTLRLGTMLGRPTMRICTKSPPRRIQTAWRLRKNWWIKTGSSSSRTLHGGTIFSLATTRFAQYKGLYAEPVTILDKLTVFLVPTRSGQSKNIS